MHSQASLRPQGPVHVALASARAPPREVHTKWDQPGAGQISLQGLCRVGSLPTTRAFRRPCEGGRGGSLTCMGCMGRPECPSTVDGTVHLGMSHTVQVHRCRSLGRTWHPPSLGDVLKLRRSLHCRPADNCDRKLHPGSSTMESAVFMLPKLCSAVQQALPLTPQKRVPSSRTHALQSSGTVWLPAHKEASQREHCRW